MRRHQRGALSALRVTGVSLLHDVKTSNRLLRDASRKQRNCCSLCLDALNELPAVSHQGAGGARRDRTDDLMLAKHALSQLSYGPVPEDECLTKASARRRPSGYAGHASLCRTAWLRHA